MSSMKCPQCGLVNWSTAEACKRCRLPINGGEAPGETHWEKDADGFEQVPEYGWDQSEGYQAQPGYQEAPYSYGYSGYEPIPAKTGLAIASMVVGIVSMVSCGLLGVGSLTGLILGIVALSKASKSPGEYGGQGFAIAGVALSVVSLFFVGIVLSIAIPNLYASIRAANEGSAIRNMKAVVAAESTYESNAGRYGTLQELSAAGLIESKLATGFKNSYVFEVRTDGKGYEVLATPSKEGDRGSRSFFYSSEDQTIRGAKKGGVAATAYDPPLTIEEPGRSQQTYRREDARPAYNPEY